MEEYALFIFRKVLIDAVILAGIGGCVHATGHAEPFQRGFFCSDETIKYPYMNNTVTSPTLHAVGVILPIIAVMICELVQLRARKEEARSCLGLPVPAWARGVYSVLSSFAIGLLCTELATNVGKLTIGRLRPCFLDVCRPSVNCSEARWQARYIHPDEFSCTSTTFSEHSLRDIRVSFPSGHSSWAAYTMVFLALYLYKRMTWQGTKLPRYFIQFSVVMLSWFTALSRVSDNKHHWSDVLTGYVLGTVFAVIVFTWCTEWIERREHAPVPQHDVGSSPQSVVAHRT